LILTVIYSHFPLALPFFQIIDSSTTIDYGYLVVLIHHYCGLQSRADQIMKLYTERSIYSQLGIVEVALKASVADAAKATSHRDTQPATQKFGIARIVPPPAHTPFAISF
jgi:hypothetical protein